MNCDNIITVKGERAVIYRGYYYKKGVGIGKPSMVYAGIHILKRGETFQNLYYKGSGSIWKKYLKWKGVLKSKKKFDKHVKTEILRVYDGIYIRQDILKEEGVCIANTIQKYGDRLCVNKKKTSIKKYGNNDVLKNAIINRVGKKAYRKMCNKVRSFGNYHNWDNVENILNSKCSKTYGEKWSDAERLIYQHYYNARVMPDAA